MSSDFSQFNTALIWAYNVLLFCIPLFAILGVAQIAVAIALWRSEKRSKLLKRAGVLFTAAALMPLWLAEKNRRRRSMLSSPRTVTVCRLSRTLELFLIVSTFTVFLLVGFLAFRSCPQKDALSQSVSESNT